MYCCKYVDAKGHQRFGYGLGFTLSFSSIESDVSDMVEINDDYRKSITAMYFNGAINENELKQILAKHGHSVFNHRKAKQQWEKEVNRGKNK